jgi:hypothetical protein
MAVDPWKRQKKLERQRTKQKAGRRESARRESRGLALRLEESAAAPLLHCSRGSRLWETGIGHVVVSRQMANGNVAFAAFLVDVYCLGVKDAFWAVTPRATYERKLYDKLAQQEELVRLTPECARKLVEGAVGYALDLGFSPHPDYRAAKLIFGDISAEDCLERFSYGKDGKPFFVAGPYDDRIRCEQILRTLEKRCGPDGYHFFVPVELE